jgi:hypothetical protein
MLALFARGLELQKAGKENFREPGAFECEYLHHVSSPLHRLLGLMPWEIPVLDVKPHTRPEKLPCAYAESFEKVRAIRLALEKAARLQKRGGAPPLRSAPPGLSGSQRRGKTRCSGPESETRPTMSPAEKQRRYGSANVAGSSCCECRWRTTSLCARCLTAPAVAD